MNKLRKAIDEWLCTEAEWWQFWMPESGFAGGFIGGIVILIILILIGMTTK